MAIPPENAAWRAIAEILADEDLMELGEGNPDPISEYRPEAEDILRRMAGWRQGEMLGEADLIALVCSVFRHWFAVDLSTHEAKRVAQKIGNHLVTETPLQ